MPETPTKPIAGPPVKPWCYRVGRTASKKFGARENWPAERRVELNGRRREKRAQKCDAGIEEMLLIAKSKMGGTDGRVARLELRALKRKRAISAEAMRREISERMERLRLQRARTQP